MRETTELTEAAGRFADRLRAAPQSRLQRGGAAEGLSLARELALRAGRLEEPTGPSRVMPDAGPFAVGDQLAVAAADFAEAWHAACARAASAEQRAALRGQLDEAVDLVRAAAAGSGL
ncbi:hypothetical protein BJP40_22795 [Streptomyces sp. CC53]|uniref:hypothetical protein n=1 Tax=unclassified Streptomyces TaxID=2593676 RepID=UPI0008DE6463|nr:MULTISPECIES: hypothetical protein [unclassified Streptomyces]OII63826.1 hypothetical protein BJP40_22795 [Streptomyces sp. CC53]